MVGYPQRDGCKLGLGQLVLPPVVDSLLDRLDTADRQVLSCVLQNTAILQYSVQAVGELVDGTLDNHNVFLSRDPSQSTASLQDPDLVLYLYGNPVNLARLQEDRARLHYWHNLQPHLGVHTILQPQLSQAVRCFPLPRLYPALY